MPINDIYCPSCNVVEVDVHYRGSDVPRCAQCRVAMRVWWGHGKAPSTDVHGPRHFDGLDGTFSSTRQAEQAAKRRARKWTEDMQSRGMNVSWEVSGVGGDKKGGARDVRRTRGSAFGYRGQKSHQSTGERRTI